jgi:hypothetical protein
VVSLDQDRSGFYRPGQEWFLQSRTGEASLVRDRSGFSSPEQEKLL